MFFHVISMFFHVGALSGSILVNTNPSSFSSNNYCPLTRGGIGDFLSNSKGDSRNRAAPTITG